MAYGSGHLYLSQGVGPDYRGHETFQRIFRGHEIFPSFQRGHETFQRIFRGHENSHLWSMKLKCCFKKQGFLSERKMNKRNLIARFISVSCLRAIFLICTCVEYARSRIANL